MRKSWAQLLRFCGRSWGERSLHTNPKRHEPLKISFLIPCHWRSRVTCSWHHGSNGVVWANLLLWLLAPFFHPPPPSSVFLLLGTRGSALPGIQEGPRGGKGWVWCYSPLVSHEASEGAWMLSSLGREDLFPPWPLSTSSSSPCVSFSLDLGALRACRLACRSVSLLSCLRLTPRWCEDSWFSCGGVRLSEGSASWWLLLFSSYCKATTYSWVGLERVVRHASVWLKEWETIRRLKALRYLI